MFKKHFICKFRNHSTTGQFVKNPDQILHEQNIHAEKVQLLESQKSSEIKDLRSVVTGLRNQIEEIQSEHGQELQKATSTFQNENLLLKESTAKIRDKLEKVQQRHQAEINKTQAEKENTSLSQKKTVLELRKELERISLDNETKVQKGFHLTLRIKILSNPYQLRIKLDNAKTEKQEAVQRTCKSYEQEILHLKSTIHCCEKILKLNSTTRRCTKNCIF